MYIRGSLDVLNDLFRGSGHDHGLQGRLVSNKGIIYKLIRGLLEPLECIGHRLGIKGGIDAWKEVLDLLNCSPGLGGDNSQFIAFQDETGDEFTLVGRPNNLIVERIHEGILLDFCHLSGNCVKLGGRNGLKGHFGVGVALHNFQFKFSF